MATELPSFSLEAYRRLLGALGAVGYRFERLHQLRSEPPPAAADATTPRIAHLRHDVDLHLRGVESLARLEAELGVPATYYVCLTLHFNLLFPENRRIVRRLVECGHDVGLHYDLETYPADAEGARRHLDWEASLLAAITGQPVRTICMHQPHRGEPDPFRMLDEYVHPHDPRYQQDQLYVSDSCRAWRDESLLRCFGPEPPRRLVLATHPELWLDGSTEDRWEYLRTVLAANGLSQHREYFEQTVSRVWLNHPAPALHDARVRKGP